MSAADHANKARDFLDDAVARGSAAPLYDPVAVAQVEATLAVAEALLEIKDDGIANRVLPIGPR